MYEQITALEAHRPVRRSVARPAAKLTIAIWTSTFFLFLAPQWVATGRIPPFYAGTIFLLICFGVMLSAILYAAASVLRARRSWIQVAGVGAMVSACALTFAITDAASGGAIIKIFMAGHHVPDDLLSMTVSNFISYSWLFGLLGTIYVILHANEMLRERDLQLVEARAMTQAAQIAALRLQLNPHFLFNTLNAISSLVVSGRSVDAEAMLGKLSAFLRTALEQDASGTVSLDQELETLQTYLEIEAVRFGNRLTIEFDVDPALLDTPVPSFILQPLVENAIKHGVAPTSKAVLIEVKAERSGSDLLLSVRNSGGPLVPPTTDGTGVGLPNTRRRLEVLYGRAGRLEARRMAGGFVATVRMPSFMSLAPL